MKNKELYEESSKMAVQLSEFIVYPYIGECVKEDFKNQVIGYFTDHFVKGDYKSVFKFIPATFDVVDDFSVQFFSTLCDFQFYLSKYSNKCLVLTVFDFRVGKVVEILPASLYLAENEELPKSVPYLDAISVDDIAMWEKVPFSSFMFCGYDIRKVRDLKKSMEECYSNTIRYNVSNAMA